MSVKEHLWHYLLLGIILAAGFWGFVNFAGDTQKRYLSLFAAILGYVLWGVWHHLIEHRLSWFVISEYLLLALVVLATLGLLLFPF